MTELRDTMNRHLRLWELVYTKHGGEYVEMAPYENPGVESLDTFVKLKKKSASGIVKYLADLIN